MAVAVNLASLWRFLGLADRARSGHREDPAPLPSPALAGLKRAYEFREDRELPVARGVDDLVDVPDDTVGLVGLQFAAYGAGEKDGPVF